jgi:UrcA family protein
MMTKGLLALAACAIGVSMPAAAATDNPFAKDEAVLSLSGLDLSTAEGQERLAIRMDAAARAVCGDRMATVHLAADSKAQVCRTAVLADIRSEIEARTAAAEKNAHTQLASNR